MVTFKWILMQAGRLVLWGILIAFFFGSAGKLAWAKEMKFETVFNTGVYNNVIVQDHEGFLWVGTTGIISEITYYI